MTTPRSSLQELAKQGDIGAIAVLMNRPLQPKGITADVTAKDDYLEVRVEGEQTPNQSALVQFVKTGLSNLGISQFHGVKLYGYRQGESSPDWEDSFDLPRLPTTVIPAPPPPMPASAGLVDAGLAGAGLASAGLASTGLTDASLTDSEAIADRNGLVPDPALDPTTDPTTEPSLDLLPEPSELEISDLNS
ncbi:MAG TPA: hypothetical protein V6C88_16855 [Chroococcidiopsis sp.]